MDSIIFYESFRSAISEMPKEHQLQAYEIVLDYGLYGIVPDFNELPFYTRMFFKQVKPVLDSNLKKREGGKRGGRPRKEVEEPEVEEKKTIGFENENHRLSNCESKDNVNVNVNDKGNVNVEDKKNEFETPDLKIKKSKTNSLRLTEKTQPPDLTTFLAYCSTILGDRYQELKFPLEAKYEAWSAAGWADGFNKPIVNWKSKVKNIIPFLKPFKNGFQKTTHAEIRDGV